MVEGVTRIFVFLQSHCEASKLSWFQREHAALAEAVIKRKARAGTSFPGKSPLFPVGETPTR
jgi:hypothetical protein